MNIIPYVFSLVYYRLSLTFLQISSGRGGIGNIRNTSDSRSRSRPPAVHSTGRGGAGNIYPGDGHIPDVIDEQERRRVGVTEGP